MLSQLSTLLSRLLSSKPFQTESLKSSELSVSSQAQSHGSSSKANLMAQIRKQLKSDEGEVLHAYQDHLGYWTIGIGRLIDKRRGGGITKEEAAYLLENDITTRLAQLENKLPWFNKLNEARQGALLNMSFQLGVPGLMNFKRTLALIEAGDYDAAADQMMLSLWARQTPNRAKRISEQIRTGTWSGQR